MSPDFGSGSRREAGFTIVELSIVLLLLSVASAMMFTFLNSATETTARTAANTQSEADAQIVLRTLLSDLRSASSISSTYPITGTCASGGSFTSTPFDSFKTCIRVTILRPSVGGQLCPKTEVTYGVLNGNLLMDRVEFAGTTSSCSVAKTTTKKVLLTTVLNNTSAPLFTFFDRKGEDLLAASPAVTPTAASSVKVTISKRYRLRGSDVVQFTDVVALRNKR